MTSSPPRPCCLQVLHHTHTRQPDRDEQKYPAVNQQPGRQATSRLSAVCRLPLPPPFSSFSSMFFHFFSISLFFFSILFLFFLMALSVCPQFYSLSFISSSIGWVDCHFCFASSSIAYADAVCVCVCVRASERAERAGEQQGARGWRSYSYSSSSAACGACWELRRPPAAAGGAAPEVAGRYGVLQHR